MRQFESELSFWRLLADRFAPNSRLVGADELLIASRPSVFVGLAAHDFGPSAGGEERRVGMLVRWRHARV